MNECIDKRDLAEIEAEYKGLCLADLTDNTNCSIGDIKYRANRMAEIEDIVSKHVADAWFQELVHARQGGMASGKKFEE